MTHDDVKAFWSAIATNTRPAVSLIPRPHAPSKSEDPRRLLDAKFEVAVRVPSPSDSKLNSRDTLPNGPVTIVAAKAITHQEAWAKHLGVPVENTVD
jgi:hypothetical protein